MTSGRNVALNREMTEPHDAGFAGRLNWLRAGVLGANDGIVSTAGIVVGVAGATTDLGTILTAGVAGLVAGALSMAGGEYVSVSTQRDTEQAALDLERWELENQPEAEAVELAGIYEKRGLSPDLARQVAAELSAHGALHAHAEAELGIDPEALTNPWSAAISSLIAFAVGALLPLLAMALPPADLRLPIAVVSVLIGLALTGGVSARLGRANPMPAIVRNVGVGIITMAITYGVGLIFGVAVN
jgi:VIT1/CCC1 family predicted Fe2+/Mn2+ transporter